MIIDLVFSGYEPDNTGGSKFTIKLWITAGQAFFTKINLMFLTKITGLTIWMVDAYSHVVESFKNGFDCDVLLLFPHWIDSRGVVK